VDLLINPTSAIENDIFTFIQANPCILGPATGCTSGSTSAECADISTLLTKPLSEFSNVTELFNEFINVKSRKTIRAYPIIELIYDRYLNSFAHCGVSSNALDNETLGNFVGLVGEFWSDLIEQVVPATSVWGSSYQHGIDIFGTDKYIYPTSTLLLFNPANMTVPSPTIGFVWGVPTEITLAPDYTPPNSLGAPSPTIGFSFSEVTTLDITNIDISVTNPIEPIPYIGFTWGAEEQSCLCASILQSDDGSEFVSGDIIIIGGDGTEITDSGTTENTVSGNTITINETITDNCSIYYNGDFDPNDYNNYDWDTPDGPSCK